MLRLWVLFLWTRKGGWGYSLGMASHTGTDTGISVYEALADRIRQRIRTSQYQPGQLIGTEHELARRESISRMTVRRASELLVNEGLLERRPGKGLFLRGAHVSTRTVQVVAGNLTWEPSLQVSRGVQGMARQRGIQVQLYDAHGDIESDFTILRQLPDSSAKGAIIISLHNAAFNEEVCRLRMRGFPLVLIDQQMRDIAVSSVVADNHAGGMMAGKALIELGHRRIAFVGDLIATTVRDRLTGLRDAMGDAGLSFDRTLVADLLEEKDRLGDWSGRIDECVRQLMGREDRPTAIFCSCDAVARTAYRTLAAMGLRVPGDVSVIGFDDDPLAEWLTPGLSTVRQPFMAMGQAAMELLTLQMTHPNSPVEHRSLPVELVMRGSTAAPPTV